MFGSYTFNVSFQIIKIFSSNADLFAKNCFFILSCFFFHITDVPETIIRLGTSLNPNTIREGTDVYFDCLIRAEPAVYKVEWRHQVCYKAAEIFL